MPDAPVRVLARRGGRLVAAGAVITSTLAVAGAGAAAAANPYSDVARVVEGVAQSVGLEWSAMPDGYTREQYEAFWGAGYTIDDVEALADLWHLDATATKAQAGQLLLDGQTPPVEPGADRGRTAPGVGPGAGRRVLGGGLHRRGPRDARGAVAHEPMETKAEAGQLVLDGETLPLG